MYTETFVQFKKRLGQLDKSLGAAADYAKSKNKAAQPQEDNEKTSPNCRRAFGRSSRRWTA